MKQSSEAPVVVGVGEILWDLLPAGRRFGGAPGNFTCYAAILGADAHLVSAVGDDPLGHEILARLDDMDVERQDVAIDPHHPTGTVDVLVDAQGKPTYTICEGVSWDFIPIRPSMLELARRADVICFGSLAQRSGISRTTIRILLAAASSKCLKVFDVNLRQHYFNEEILAAGLEAADVLKINDEELPVLAGMLGLQGSETAMLACLRDRFGLRLVVLTKGENGSALFGADELSVHPGIPAKVVDTVGAGDAFTAAVTMGFLHGHSLESINHHANRIASYVCSQPGGTPELAQQRKHVRNLLAKAS